MLDGIDDVHAAMRGGKIVHLDLKNAAPSRAELAAALIGPSGKLRAPVLRIGRTLLVGYNEEMYRRFT